MMKRIPALAGGALLAAAAAVPALAQLATPRPSPNATVSQVIGVTDVKVTYSRPAVKGRKIWGDLVPYDQVWRTGANEATTISFGGDVTIEGNKLAAGLYSLHTIPGKTEWTVIVNKDANQWGSYSYDEKKDALRFKVKPEPAEMTELLTIGFPAASAGSGQLAITWEKLKVAFTITVDTNAQMLANAKDAIAKAKPGDWQTPLTAARWAYDNKVAPADAAAWLDASIKAKETFGNLGLKARVLAEQGKKVEAVAAAEKALAAGKAAEQKPSAQAVADLEKKIAEWKK